MTNSGIFLGRESHQLSHDSESLERGEEHEIVEDMLDYRLATASGDRDVTN
jgi:hypothetical protein